MTFNDILKKSFLENFASTDSSQEMLLLCMAAAALLGIYIFLIYRAASDSGFYSRTFNLSLMLMCVITAAIILTIQNSVVISLGMVGALSIVRFRTAVKEPLDLIFLFWSISVGIITGAGMLGLAVLLSALVTVLLFLFRRMPEGRKSMLLSVNAVSNDAAAQILDTVRRYDKKYRMVSRTLTDEAMDMLLELRLADYEPLLGELDAMDSVRSVSLIAHKGDAAL